MYKKIWIQKFGGSVIKDETCLPQAVRHILRKKQEGYDVVCVISAFQGHTNALEKKTLSILGYETREYFYNDWILNPMNVLLSQEYANFLSTGEQQSAALLSMSLNAVGLQAQSFLGWQMPLYTDSAQDDQLHHNTHLHSIHDGNLIKVIQKGVIPIVAGFQGIHPITKRTTILEREGSDLTAVALAIALKAEVCEFFKDVGCIFTKDPKIYPDSQPIRHLSYKDAHLLLDTGTSIVHKDTLIGLERASIPLKISSFVDPTQENSGTWIGIIPKKNQKNIFLDDLENNSNYNDKIFNLKDFLFKNKLNFNDVDHD